MKFVDKYDAGRFCWYELGATAPAAAEQFYGALFGWRAAHVPEGEERYTLAQSEGRDVAGIYQLNAEQIGMGIPPRWLLYVAVADADETTAKAQAAGGSVLMGPMDVMDVSRMSVLQDPAGAVFAVWQALQHPASQVIDAEGTWCWPELATRDVAGSKEFYAKVFGWSAATAPMGPMEIHPVPQRRGSSRRDAGDDRAMGRHPAALDDLLESLRPRREFAPTARGGRRTETRAHVRAGGGALRAGRALLPHSARRVALSAAHRRRAAPSATPAARHATPFAARRAGGRRWPPPRPCSGSGRTAGSCCW